MSDSHKISIDKLGTPGIPGELVIVDVIPNYPKSDENRMNDKSKRQFIVKAKLSKNSVIPDTIEAAVKLEEGSSFILAHPDALYSKLKTNDGEFKLLHNERRELSGIEYVCISTSVQDAKELFLKSVFSFLDYLSFLTNSPIFVPLIECVDKDNNLNAVNYVSPHPNVTLNPHFKNMNISLIPVYALYREAKNTASSFYKFLCYFKILEGIFNHVRPETFKAARSKGIEISRVKEVIPKIEELRETNSETSGKSIKDIFDNRFTPEFRNKVAHYILDSGHILNVSDYSTSMRFSRELILLETCVRIVILNQEKYCESLLQEKV